MVKELEIIEHMQKLELKDGDMLVIKTDMRLSQAAVVNIKESLRVATESLGKNIKTIILEEGMTVGVLRDKVACNCDEMFEATFEDDQTLMVEGRQHWFCPAHGYKRR